MLTQYPFHFQRQQLQKTASRIGSGGALNLSQPNQLGSNQQQHLHQQQQQQQHWMSQADYFSGGSFAHWMSVGLDQPSTSNMGQANYNFGGQGSRNDGDQQQQPSRSYTPAESIHSGTKARIIATFL